MSKTFYSLSFSRNLTLLGGLVAMLLCCAASSAFAQAGEWTWMNGSSTLSQGQYAWLSWPGVFGTLGVPSATNTPGGRSAACSWSDRYGNLWLFGGIGLDSTGTQAYLNDLWKYSSASGEWTWIGGTNTAPGYHYGTPGIYGTLGSAALGNAPGGRESAACWTDYNGNFWLFGGYGAGNSMYPGELNDLWEYDPSTNEWSWMSGSSTTGGNGFQLGVYGTLGIPDPGNIPGSRDSAVGWTDASGNLWLFGGYGDSAVTPSGYLNDLWEFNPSTMEWTWMGGSNKTNQLGVYGSVGVGSVGNIPGSRKAVAAWRDANGSFWLLGGTGYDSTHTSIVADMNDLWEYKPSNGLWTWVSGSDNIEQSGVYGTLGVPSSTNIPGSRDSAVTWTDNSGNLWLFGGAGYDSSGYDGVLNDLWKFDPASGEWTWVNGSSVSKNGAFNCYSNGTICGQLGVYGTLDTPAPGNAPGSRGGGMGWTDGSGNFWLYGGPGFDSAGNFANLNDLWEYIPPVEVGQPTATPTFSVAAGTYSTSQTVEISDATSGASVYYTNDGTTPSTSSTVYTGPIIVTKSETLSAIAVASGYTASTLATAQYTILQTPVINWPTPTAVTYGTPLSSAQLNATTNVPGTFSYAPAAGTVLTAGQHTITATFTPTDTTDYTTATSTVVLTVNKAAPIITWPTPASIVAGTSLSSTQLDATASVPGTFAYSPSAGTVLAAGSQTLTTVFTPADSADYSTASASVILTVTAPSSFTLNASPSSLTVARRKGGTVTITIAGQNGFHSSVTLAVSELPKGVTAVFGPNPTTGSSALTFKVSPSAKSGIYPVTVEGVSGSLSLSLIISLTIK